MEGLGVDNWEAKVCEPRSRAVYIPIQPDFMLDLIEKL